MITLDDYLNMADIQKGDVLDVASDMLSCILFFKENRASFSMDVLLDALKDRVGDGGTVLIRTFNWDFCHGVPFDYNKTPSQVGSLGNAALKRKDFRRSKHPIYSWAVYGKDADYLCGLENIKSFGKGTIWDYFEKVGAKMLRIGNTQALSLTHLHHIEQELNVDYRYEKTFQGQYIDERGNMRLKSYSMFVRRLDLEIFANSDTTLERLDGAGVMNRTCCNNKLEILSVNLAPMYDLIREDFHSGHRGIWVTVR